MAGCYISAAYGGYYEGDQAHVLDQEVPQRPSPLHDWANGQWTLNALKVAEAQRLSDLDAAVAGDATIAALKAMTNAEFDAWWTANVTNAAQAIAVLKRLTRAVIRRLA